MSLKKIAEILDLSKSKNYTFNKKLFRYSLLLIVSLLIISFALNGWTIKPSIYFECPLEAKANCQNPFFPPIIPTPEFTEFFNKYINDDCQKFLCNQEVLLPGTIIGSRPNWLFRNFSLFTIIILFLTFLLNHLLYNKNNKLKFPEFDK